MDRRAFLTRVAGAVAGLVAIRAAVPESVQAVDGAAWLVTDPVEMVWTGGVTLPEMAVTPMPAMVPGQPYCTVCDARLMPSFGWQGSNHVAVRLWHHREVGPVGFELAYLQMPTKVTVNGERVEWVYESYRGDPGWVLAQRLYRDESGREYPELCSHCGWNDDLRELHIGRVEYVEFQRDHRVASVGLDRVEALESWIMEQSR